MECPRMAPGTNSRGEVALNEFYQVEEMRELANAIIEKYQAKSECPPYKQITHWVFSHIQYMSDIKQFGLVDYWLFPNEVLETRAEDCDGISFLTASLLEAAGYNTAVCLGDTPFGYHAWVEFRDDDDDDFIVEATTGKVYAKTDARRLGYEADIYIYPESCQYAIRNANRRY
jgi:hypothetical protein